MSIKFYKVGEPFGCFSNFSQHGFEKDGRYWPTSEHYFQAQKFEDEAVQEKIRNAKTPMHAAQLGRSRDFTLRGDWEEHKVAIMKAAVYEKFMNHPDIAEVLLSTGDEEIIENSPGDSYWGCGSEGDGKNMLGKVLAEVRAELRGDGHKGDMEIIG